MLDVSICIPSPHATDLLEATLLSLLENRPPRCEIVVVHAGHYDDPYQLADEVRFVEHPSATSSVELLNVGLSVCRGEMIHTLAPGCLATEGWLEQPRQLMADSGVAMVAPYWQQSGSSKTTMGLQVDRLGFRQDRVAGQARQVLGPAMQAGFYRIAAAKAAGGWNPVFGPYADLDLALVLHAAGGVCQVAPESLITSEQTIGARITPFEEAKLAKTVHARHRRQIAGLVGPAGWSSLVGRAVCGLSGVQSLAGYLSAGTPATEGPSVAAVKLALKQANLSEDFSDNRAA